MKYWKDREEEIGTLITLLSFFEISHWRITMNTLKKEAKTVGPKQILFLLKKSPGNRHMTAVIEHVTEDGEIKVVDNRKLIKINSRDGCDMFLKEMHNNFEECDNGNPPKITQVSKTNRQPSTNTRKCAILKNHALHATKSGFCQTFREILYERRITDNFNIKVSPETNGVDSASTNLVSTLNKQDRFVPNILRNTKVAENTSNNNNDQIETHSFRDPASHRSDRNIKRKRKQVLNSLDVELGLNRRAQIVRKKNEFKRLLSRTKNCRLPKKSKTKTSGVTTIKSEPKEKNDCPEMIAERIGSEEAQIMGNSNPHDLCSAKLEIPCEIHNFPGSKQEEVNCIDDKSIEKIFAEFEVADYQNYIASEDLGFYIDELDKLLSSDIDGSLTGASIFDNDTGIVERDVNGNDIDNYGNTRKKNNDENKIESNNVQCRIEPCYYGGIGQRIPSSERLKCDLSSDIICPGPGCGGRGDRMFEPNSWPTEFEDYYSSDDYPDLCHTLHENSSSTDTASEAESNGHCSEQSSSLISPKTKKIGSLGTLLTVTDVVPDNVFDDNSDRCCSNSFESEDDDDMAKWFLDSRPMMQQYQLNSTDFNDTGYFTSSPGLPVEKLRSNFKIDDRFDSDCGLLEDGNFLRDDILSIDCAVSKEDETCERILADSNAKFDPNNLFNIQSGIFDLDIENINDIEISRLLRSGSANNFSTVCDATPELCVTNRSDEELGIDTVNHTDKNNISISDNDNSQFGCIKFENLEPAQVERIFEPSYLNGKEDLRFSFENDVGSEEKSCRTIDEDFQCFNSSLGHISPRSEELVLPCNGEAKDLGGGSPIVQAFLPLTIEGGGSTTELAMSRLESLLRQAPACGEYPSNATNDSKISDPKHCSEISGHPGTRTFDSTFPLCRSCRKSIETSYENFNEKLCSHVPQERNITAQGASTNLDDDYSVSERRYNHLMHFDSECVQDSRNSQQISYSECSMKPASPGKVPVKLKKRKKDLWRRFLKRRKSLTQNTSYAPCDSCEMKFGSQAALADHIKLTHRYKPSQCRYKEKKYVCDKCSKEYCLPGAIEKHFKLHENYVLTCRICEKHFTEKILLRRHVYSAHLHWNVECNYCGRKFLRQNELTQHLKKCHGISRCWSESSL